MKIDELEKKNKGDITWLMVIESLINSNKTKESRSDILHTMSIIALGMFWLLATLGIIMFMKTLI